MQKVLVLSLDEGIFRDSTVESFTVLNANDVNGYVNPDAINTMRNRIFFIKGFPGGTRLPTETLRTCLIK